MKQAERTQVVGLFTGWDGNTVVTLANGQTYRQAQNFNYAYRVQAPMVNVYEELGECFLEVDGTNVKVRVRRI